MELGKDLRDIADWSIKDLTGWMAFFKIRDEEFEKRRKASEAKARGNQRNTR